MSRRDEQRYMDFVAGLPCCLCRKRPVELHHPRFGEGAQQRAGNFLVIPLCPDCHRGPLGVHGDKTMLRVNKTTELELINQTTGRYVARFTM